MMTLKENADATRNTLGLSNLLNVITVQRTQVQGRI